MIFMTVFGQIKHTLFSLTCIIQMLCHKPGCELSASDSSLAVAFHHVKIPIQSLCILGSICSPAAFNPPLPCFHPRSLRLLLVLLIPLASTSPPVSLKTSLSLTRSTKQTEILSTHIFCFGPSTKELSCLIHVE